MRQHFRLCLLEPTTILVSMQTLPSLLPRPQAALLVLLQAQGPKGRRKITRITRRLVTGFSHLLSGESLHME